MNMWGFFQTIFDFFKAFADVANRVWNWSWDIGFDFFGYQFGITLTFQGIATVSLIAVIGFVLVKKIVPIA